jgi:hypothetical protein
MDLQRTCWKEETDDLPRSLALAETLSMESDPLLRRSGNTKNSVQNPIKEQAKQAPVAHTCNPSYSGGRDLQFEASPISKKPIMKKGWWSGSRFRP